MPRMSRVVVSGVAHHITQRGVRRAPIFLDEHDRLQYAEILAENCARYGVRIRAYCWMTNHIHLIAVPEKGDAFARTFRRAHSRYAREFNRKHGFSGYLWQDRFYSSPLDPSHMWAAIRYVEQNPVRAGMVANAEDYRWSSARARCLGEFDALLDPDWDSPIEGMAWAEWLSASDDPLADRIIRVNTVSGMPCGDGAFVEQLERFAGRVLRRQRPGPKPKTS